MLFPVLWVVSLSLDPRDLSRPDSLIPPSASLDAYAKVIAQPTSNDDLVPRSWPSTASFIAVRHLAGRVSIGVLAAYAFSRLQFRGREFLMIAILGVLMLPAVATIAPLFVS